MITPAVVRLAKPKNPTKPKSRLAHNVAIDDEDSFIPNAKRETMMANYDYDTSRGPYHAMLDRMARARQAITGESYAKAFTETYIDPKNAAIRDGSKYDDLAKSFDAVYGTSKSLIPVVKEAPYDPLRKAAETAEILGPAHARLHSQAVDHQRANPRLSYESAYSRMYTHPENASLRAEINREHLRATMARANG